LTRLQTKLPFGSHLCSDAATYGINPIASRVLIRHNGAPKGYFVDKNLKEIAQQTAAVEGWLARAEGKLLYRLAKRCTGRGVIVEIGSWKGKSTIWLASGSRAASRSKVHSIDPHTGSPQHHDMFGKV